MKKLSGYLIVLIVYLVPVSSQAQAKMRKLPNSLNNPSYNAWAPYLSADANAIVFITDNAEDYVPTPFYSFRDNADWKEPQLFPKSIYSRLNFLKGFALSADGKKVFFSTLKSPGVGGFDIWVSDWKGNTWSDPVNFGLPLNTKGHEGAPSVSTDGNTLYFMRCEKMDQNKADNCKIFKVTKKINGQQWDEPVELPATINTGNSQSPRIMADGESLIFSSDKMTGGKGGMDLYMTKFVNGNWSKPVALDFANTEKDDQHISIAALGRYLIRDAMGPRKNELIEYLIPDALRPRGMMKIDGKVSDGKGGVVPAYVSITDLTQKKRVFNGRPYADGSFIVYVMEGSEYELAVDPEFDNISYYSKRFDLKSEKIPQVEKVNAVIKPLSNGDELSLDNVKFKPNSSEIDVAESAGELKKLMRLVKTNPAFKFEIQVMLTGYVEDSVQSSPDLTEVIYDSLQATYDDIDSLGQLFQHDTTLVRATYHNNRTWQQVQSIIQYLVSQGANEKSFGFFGNAIPATLPENRKLTVKAMVRPK